MISKIKQQKGFTIVELLIVIVIIGILAAITIVAYNGITQRANTSAAKSAASNTVAKAEAYNAETGAYPTAGTQLTSATSDKTYQLVGVTTQTTAITTAPSTTGNVVVRYTACTGGANVDYWNYTDGVVNTLKAGAGC